MGNLNSEGKKILLKLHRIILEASLEKENQVLNPYFPTKLSKTLDFPALCPPTTAI